MIDRPSFRKQFLVIDVAHSKYENLSFFFSFIDVAHSKYKNLLFFFSYLQKIFLRKMVKYQFWKNVTSEEWNSGTLNTFGHFLSSFLGVIAECSSNHAQKWRQKVSKSFTFPKFTSFKIGTLAP